MARHAWALRRFAALAIASVCACAPPAQRAPVLPASTHAIESPRLARLMRELERLSRERLPQAMDLEQERARRVYKVARTASAIAQSAEQLEGAIAGAALSAPELQEFAEHADDLRVQARELAEHAHQLSPPAMRAQAAALEAICTNCHHRFRIKGVP